MKTMKTKPKRSRTNPQRFPANCKTWPMCACIMRGNARRDCDYLPEPYYRDPYEPIY